jgi:hypothetical protein
MRTSWSGALPLTAALLLCVTSGCRREPPAPVEVHGRVEKADGKPAREVVLTFHPLDETNKNASLTTLTLDGQGRFEGQFLPGRYKVKATAMPVGEATPVEGVPVPRSPKGAPVPNTETPQPGVGPTRPGAGPPTGLGTLPGSGKTEPSWEVSVPSEEEIVLRLPPGETGRPTPGGPPRP